MYHVWYVFDTIKKLAKSSKIHNIGHGTMASCNHALFCKPSTKYKCSKLFFLFFFVVGLSICLTTSLFSWVSPISARLPAQLCLVCCNQCHYVLCSIGMLSKSKTFTMITAVLLPLVTCVRVSILPRNQIEYVYCLQLRWSTRWPWSALID